MLWRCTTKQGLQMSTRQQCRTRAQVFSWRKHSFGKWKRIQIFLKVHFKNYSALVFNMSHVEIFCVQLFNIFRSIQLLVCCCYCCCNRFYNKNSTDDTSEFCQFPIEHRSSEFCTSNNFYKFRSTLSPRSRLSP